MLPSSLFFFPLNYYSRPRKKPILTSSSTPYHHHGPRSAFRRCSFRLQEIFGFVTLTTWTSCSTLWHHRMTLSRQPKKFQIKFMLTYHDSPSHPRLEVSDTMSLSHLPAAAHRPWIQNGRVYHACSAWVGLEPSYSCSLDIKDSVSYYLPSFKGRWTLLKVGTPRIRLIVDDVPFESRYGTVNVGWGAKGERDLVLWFLHRGEGGIGRSRFYFRYAVELFRGRGQR